MVRSDVVLGVYRSKYSKVKFRGRQKNYGVDLPYMNNLYLTLLYQFCVNITTKGPLVPVIVIFVQCCYYYAVNA